MLVAEYWAEWLGIELNAHKREPCKTETRHLGFRLNLAEKVITITTKHSRKVRVLLEDFNVHKKIGLHPGQGVAEDVGTADMDKYSV